jgi:uncharacterized membrane protein YbhN (UPF0104 family)
VAVLAGLVATMQVWRTLLAALGSPLPVGIAARIFFLGQVGKYIPGSMWPVLMQMELAQAARVPRSRTAVAAALTLMTSLCAGLLVALCAVNFRTGVQMSGLGWVGLAIPVLLVLLHPRVVNAAAGRLLRLTARPPLAQSLSGRAVVVALGWALTSWLLLGTQVWLLANRLGAPPGRTLLLAVGGFAFAWSVGFLVVFVPAGVGVRDVLLVAALAPVLDLGAATAVALVSRILMSAGDLLLAATAGWAARHRHPAARRPDR